MKSLDYGQFRQRQIEILQMEEEKFQAVIREYPDLKIFEDCRKMSEQFDLVIARP